MLTTSRPQNSANSALDACLDTNTGSLPSTSREETFETTCGSSKKTMPIKCLFFNRLGEGRRLNRPLPTHDNCPDVQASSEENITAPSQSAQNQVVGQSGCDGVSSAPCGGNQNRFLRLCSRLFPKLTKRRSKTVGERHQATELEQCVLRLNEGAKPESSERLEEDGACVEMNLNTLVDPLNAVASISLAVAPVETVHIVVTHTLGEEVGSRLECVRLSMCTDEESDRKDSVRGRGRANPDETPGSPPLKYARSESCSFIKSEHCGEYAHDEILEKPVCPTINQVTPDVTSLRKCLAAESGAKTEAERQICDIVSQLRQNDDFIDGRIAALVDVGGFGFLCRGLLTAVEYFVL